MIPSLNNKIVFITGGSSGIGLETAKAFSADGAHVVIFARNRERLEAGLREIQAAGPSNPGRSGFFVLDVSNREAVGTVIEAAVKEFGVPDILINNAGRAYPGKFEDISCRQFDETMKINLYGTWNTCSVLVPLMKERGGAIVNVSSIAGFLGIYGYTDYCASKFAIIGFSEALRQELSACNISVHVVCPPDTDTPGLKNENATKPDETKAISAGAKLMKPAEVAKAIVAGIKKGSFFIKPGFDGKLTHFLKRHLPSLVDYMVNRSIKKVVDKQDA